VDYSHLGHPIDNVYFYHKYDVHRWNFAEAVQNHRELHHPSMYNRPNCPLLVRMHLDFRYPNRPNKFQDGWKSVVEMKLPFLLPGMAAPTVLAFCPNDESMIADAIEAGADLAGGSDLIRSVQSGAVNPNDYEYIVAHPQLIVELTAIRGLMKRKFPNLKTKTLDVDIVTLVKKFKAGMKIAGQKTDLEPDYGWVEAPIGTLDMDIEGMEGNFESIFADTITHRVAGRTAETFVLGCVLKTAYSFEQFKLNTDKYFLKYDKKATKPAAEVTEETSEETAEQEESVQKEKATSS
jgi:large subunit ribosomal protein L1